MRTELVLDLDPALHPVRADGPLLVQAISNLVENAADAMPGGGSIVVCTRNADVRRAGRHSRRALRGRQRRGLGCGLDESTLEHVFEPFFTTKERRRPAPPASGSRARTAWPGRRGGTITVESEPGVGSIFSVYLPEVDRGRSAASSTAGQGRRSSSSNATPPCATCVFEVLTDRPYRVLTARRPRTPCGLAERLDGPIDLLLTELDELREGALLALLRERRPR